jgi:hypothetical protein
MTHFLETPWGFGSLCVAAALVALVVVLIARGRLSFRRGADGEMVIERFQRLCDDTQRNGDTARTIAEQIATLRAHVDETKLSLLRLVIHDERISPDERIRAGQEYLDLDGTGDTRAEVETMVLHVKDNYKELRLAHQSNLDALIADTNEK